MKTAERKQYIGGDHTADDQSTLKQTLQTAKCFDAISLRQKTTHNAKTKKVRLRYQNNLRYAAFYLSIQHNSPLKSSL